MDQMREQALRFGADLRMEDVDAVDLTGPIKKVTVGDETYQARAVILAMAPPPAISASPVRTHCWAWVSAPVPPVTGSSSATRTSPSSAVVTLPWRRPPS